MIYKNNDFCSATLNTAALPYATTKQDWGFDYVYSTEVTSFSSFYFAKASGALPVKILSFTGIAQPAGNKLDWKTVCTNAVDFIIERSTDGLHFDSIGINKAQQIDCDHPFTFTDATAAAISYYRIKMLEDNGSISYSSIVVIERNGNKALQVTLMPNPVVGSEAKLQIISSQAQQLLINISDAQGRLVMNTSLKINAGTNSQTLFLPAMSTGIYYLRYGSGHSQQTIKLIKQ
ncbi:MAG: T9SS type A sorting domain-containing protein [Pedobacter sp.]|nr:MAG: T9SS type A sorting domain-containing protein [Pedobacter sp.]